jgi:hypothetical protein
LLLKSPGAAETATVERRRQAVLAERWIGILIGVGDWRGQKNRALLKGPRICIARKLAC